MTGRPPILLVLTGLFGASVAARGAEAVEGMRTEEVAASPARSGPDFDALDAWSSDLDRQAEAVEARAIAADITLAEAKRHAARATAAEATGRTGEARRLAALYASMPAAKAASLLEALPAAQAADILTAMPPQTAGAVLSQMTPDAGRTVARTLGARG